MHSLRMPRAAPLTTLALEDGRVLFFEDIYHHDEKLAKSFGP